MKRIFLIGLMTIVLNLYPQNKTAFLHIGMGVMDFPTLDISMVKNQFPESAEIQQDFTKYRVFTENLGNYQHYMLQSTNGTNGAEFGAGVEFPLGENLVLRPAYIFYTQYIYEKAYRQLSFHAAGPPGNDTLNSDYYGFNWDFTSNIFSTDILLFTNERTLYSEVTFRVYGGIGYSYGNTKGALHVKHVKALDLGTRSYSITTPAVEILESTEITYHDPNKYTLSRVQIPIGFEGFYKSNIGVNVEIKAGRGSLNKTGYFHLTGNYLSAFNIMLKIRV